MNKYIVSANVQGRIILDMIAHGKIFQNIIAGDYWQARIKVDESPFYHYEGHGWFER